MKKAKGVVVAVLTAGMLLSATALAAGQDAPVVAREVKGGVESVQVTNGTYPLHEVELTESQQQAMEKIYQIVPELKELTVEGVHEGGEDAWGVTLSNRAGEAVSGIMCIRASLSFKTGTNELVRFDIRNPDWASLELPPAELAKEKAYEFARQVLGDKIKDYRMSDGIGFSSGGARDSKGNEINWTEAGVQFERLINGIPMLNSGIRVDVDAAGHVTEYYTDGFYQINGGIKYEEPDLAAFPSPALAITGEAAEEIFAGLLEMKLNYVGSFPLQYPKYRSGEVETRPVLMYAPSAYASIDAVTGEPLAGFQQPPQISLVSLTGEGKKLVAATPEEAAALLAAETGMDIAGMKLSGEDEVEESLQPGIKVKTYHLNSEPQTGQDGTPDYSTMRYLYLRTLADTGQVVGFNLQDEAGHGEKATVSRAAAQETAIQFLQRYLDRGAAEMEMYVSWPQEESIPDWVDRSKLEGNEQRPEYNFAFTCTHQGIPVSDRGYSVTVDGLTGGITAFHDRNSSSSVTLPDSKNVVTAEAAKAEFLKSHPLRLVYLWPEYYGQKAPEPVLVYMPDHGAGMEYIDAFTGKTVTAEMD
ncbi:hypothetical protein Psch_01270 [Pelotomaculum schinkii]|uniref:YcdB/YcdC repeated domain-containing protein n=1 Tax=Pelotomaculum schinkii TaxID=78350 RepID=A0A4Y7RFE0_9FIRM|nr:MULTISPECIES: YcdB/YcdC domain-containing protein [Pelotomaculum]TEB07715.1 hypothetical protein Psch_01270 [Pelotomaculum schinkii]TEB14073.1 hypothetical protein Psfp_03198 [Pelotomaculum sp. FP]